MIQHADSDLEFQEKMLKIIKEEAKNGNVDADDFAHLMDRVQLAKQKPQVYGTRLDYNTDSGQAFPEKLIDSVNVNERRENLGLESIEEYLNKSTKLHFQMNKKTL